MAKSNGNKTNGFEQNLWDTANKLRGSVESSEYKHVVLSLIFLKFASDKFEERRAELMAEGKDKYLDMVEFYTMKNVFYLPEKSRWRYINSQAKQDDLAIKIDTALATVEKTTRPSKGPCRTTIFPAWGWMPASWRPSSIPSPISTRWPTRKRMWWAGSMSISWANLRLQRARAAASSIRPSAWLT